ncbi:VWA domain-containing protein [Corynebacterium sp. 32222D000AT]
MARHANDKNNFAIAGWLIAVIVLVILVVLGLLLYLFTGNDDTGDGTDTAAQETTQAAEETATDEPAASESSAASEAPSSAESSAPASESAAASTAAAAGATAPDAPEATLFLLDTSDQMAPYFDAAAGGVAGAAEGVGGEDKAVSLWNYSSPISATATVGYRQNLGFSDAGETASVVNNFGTGGVPQTRSAIVAAANNAADYARESNAPARVVLVTTGTDDALADEDFASQLASAKDSNVEISVVHLGDGEVDKALEDAADYFEKVDRADDTNAVNRAIGTAAGVK